MIIYLKLLLKKAYELLSFSELMETAFQTNLLPKYELRKNSTRNSDCMEDSVQNLSGLLTSFADFDRQWMELDL